MASLKWLLAVALAAVIAITAHGLTVHSKHFLVNTNFVVATAIDHNALLRVFFNYQGRAIPVILSTNPLAPLYALSLHFLAALALITLLFKLGAHTLKQVTR